MTAEQPLDVNAIRARLDAVGDRPWTTQHNSYGDEWWFGGSSGSGENVLAFGDDDLGVLQGDCRAEAELIAHAPTDLRRLLDENARLNAEVDRRERQIGLHLRLAHEESTKAERMRVERDRAINECDDWETKYAELSVERDALRRALPAAPETLSAFDGAPPIRANKDGSQSYGPYAAPEMPRPPAQEAQAAEPSIPMQYGPHCEHKPEWHCSAHGECRACECGCFTYPPAPVPEGHQGAAQPGAGGTDTSPAGSGRGTGVAEAPGAEQESDHA